MFDELIKLGYTLQEKNEDLEYLRFIKIENGGDAHVIILENHTFEKNLPDFDSSRDIGDWLVHSYCPNDARDYFGHFIDVCYALTFEEVKAISAIIDRLRLYAWKRGEK